MKDKTRFLWETKPLALSENTVCGDKYRFSILTPSLIRMEYSENGIFIIIVATQTIAAISAVMMIFFTLDLIYFPLTFNEGDYTRKLTIFQLPIKEYFI